MYTYGRQLHAVKPSFRPARRACRVYDYAFSRRLSLHGQQTTPSINYFLSIFSLFLSLSPPVPSRFSRIPPLFLSHFLSIPLYCARSTSLAFCFSVCLNSLSVYRLLACASSTLHIVKCSSGSNRWTHARHAVRQYTNQTEPGIASRAIHKSQNAYIQFYDGRRLRQR